MLPKVNNINQVTSNRLIGSSIKLQGLKIFLMMDPQIAIEMECLQASKYYINSCMDPTLNRAEKIKSKEKIVRILNFKLAQVKSRLFQTIQLVATVGQEKLMDY